MTKRKNELKIVKGTRIKFWCCTHDRESDDSRITILEDDYTHEELNEMAKEYMWQQKEPEWGWEIVE